MQNDYKPSGNRRKNCAPVFSTEDPKNFLLQTLYNQNKCFAQWSEVSHLPQVVDYCLSRIELFKPSAPQPVTWFHL